MKNLRKIELLIRLVILIAKWKHKSLLMTFFIILYCLRVSTLFLKVVLRKLKIYLKKGDSIKPIQVLLFQTDKIWTLQKLELYQLKLRGSQDFELKYYLLTYSLHEAESFLRS